MKFLLPGKLGLILFFYLAGILIAPPSAQEVLPPRLQVGINLLPAVIAANNGLKTVDEKKKPPIYLVYRDNDHLSEMLQENLERIDKIRKRFDIEPISLENLLALDPDPYSTIFVSEKLDKRLPELIEFSQKQQALLFSPFKGDVKRGVATGFRVTDKVLPMVNMQSLKKSKIQLKAFFLRAAVQHE